MIEMVQIEIKQDGYSVEAKEVLEREVKPFGNSSAHIIVPKKWVGYTIIVVMPVRIGQWAKGYLEKFRKRGDKKESV